MEEAHTAFLHTILSVSSNRGGNYGTRSERPNSRKAHTRKAHTRKAHFIGVPERPTFKYQKGPFFA